MSIIEQAEKEGVHIRPEVKKHFHKFKGYVDQVGSKVVKELLKEGKAEKNGQSYRLTFLKNGKDRRQMMQLLDL